MKMDFKILENKATIIFTRERDGETRNVTIPLSEFETVVKKGCEELKILTLDSYQEKARATRTGETLGDAKYIYPTLGLTGEAGEVSDKVKKVIRDNNGDFDEEHCRAIALEDGDVLWYAAALSDDLGYKLNNVAWMNLDKLASRQQRNKLHGSGDER